MVTFESGLLFKDTDFTTTGEDFKLVAVFKGDNLGEARLEALGLEAVVVVIGSLLTILLVLLVLIGVKGVVWTSTCVAVSNRIILQSSNNPRLLMGDFSQSGGGLSISIGDSPPRELVDSREADEYFLLFFRLNMTFSLSESDNMYLVVNSGGGF